MRKCKRRAKDCSIWQLTKLSLWKMDLSVIFFKTERTTVLIGFYHKVGDIYLDLAVRMALSQNELSPLESRSNKTYPHRSRSVKTIVFLWTFSRAIPVWLCMPLCSAYCCWNKSKWMWLPDINSFRVYSHRTHLVIIRKQDYVFPINP